MFLPFYAKWRRPNLTFDMLFPFYGKLEVGQRRTRGYFLALYNIDENLRTGIREERYFWFLGRRRTPIEGIETDPRATTGGGFFPFYTRVSNDTRIYKTIVWPFHRYFVNHHDDHTDTRSYVFPFYSSRVREHDDGTVERSRMIFPFFRRTESRNGTIQTNALHLIPYAGLQRAIERNWIPLWTLWEKQTDLQTGERWERALGTAYRHERLQDGTIRRRLNLLLLDHESVESPCGTKTGHTRLLFGLAGRHRDPDLKTELFGFRF